MPRLNYGFKGPALTPPQAAAINAPTSTPEYVYSAQLGSVAVLLPPGTPSITSATAGNASVALVWTAPSTDSPILGYVVDYSFDGGSDWTTFSIVAETSTSVTGLVNDQPYIFRVSALSIIGQSPWSASSSVVTPVAVQPDDYAAFTNVLLRMDGNTADAFGATVSVTGTPSYQTGRFGNAMTGASVTVPTANYGSSAFVVEGWFKIPPGTLLDANSYNVYNLYRTILFGFGNGIEPGYGFDGHLFRGIHVQRWPSGNSGVALSITYKGDGGGGGYAYTSPANGFLIDDNQWHHIAMVRSADNSLRLYIDGTVASSGTINANAGSLDTAPQIFRTSNTDVILDELRVTIGSDRGFTGNTITVPAAPFQDPLSIAPNAPTALTATAGVASVALSWTAPAANGASAVSDYVVQYSTDGTNWTTFSDGVSATNSASVTGLTNGQQYSFRVAAVNASGTSSYSSVASATPAEAATLTVTAQPLNNFSATSTDSASFSISASITGGGSISYQWQYYGYDENYNASWLNIAGATTSSLSVSPNTASTLMPTLDMYESAAQIRCVVSGTLNAGTQTSSVVRWMRFTSLSPYAEFFGNDGGNPSGAVTVGGRSYTTLALPGSESLAVTLYDMGYPSDITWYTSNAFTVKIQVSDDASTWTDVNSTNFRGSGFWNNVVVPPVAASQKYYRSMLYFNWPYTTLNGTGSASRSLPEPVFMAGAFVTWS